jgi:hypothetical protein
MHGVNCLQVRVFLALCHMLAGAIWAITNIFGMNLGLLYDDLDGSTHTRFLQVGSQSWNSPPNLVESLSSDLLEGSDVRYR